MKYRVVGALLALSILSSISHKVGAQDLSPRAKEILATTTSADGWLSEDQHREFWATLPKQIVADTRFKEALSQLLERTTGHALKFQVETWTSIRASAKNARVTKSKDFDVAARAVSSADTLPAYLEQARKGVENAERMIVAAAQKAAFQTPRGTLYLTEELADQVLSGLEASFCRFRRLTKPVWDETDQEYAYPEARVKVLASCPFVRTTTDRVFQGVRVKTTLVDSTLSKEDHLSIGFTNIGKQWPDPERAVVRVAEEALGAIGVKARPFVEKWRGRVAAIADGVAVLSSGKLFGSIRVIEGREHGAAWSITVLSDRSAVEATTLREWWESRIQLDGR